MVLRPSNLYDGNSHTVAGMVLTIGASHLRGRVSHDSPISIMGIPILVRWYLDIETVPVLWALWVEWSATQRANKADFSHKCPVIYSFVDFFVLGLNIWRNSRSTRLGELHKITNYVLKNSVIFSSWLGIEDSIAYGTHLATLIQSEYLLVSHKFPTYLCWDNRGQLPP